ncbi:NAD(P)-binding domain-containing protein [Actinocorallia sp. API 0066]|uniref:NAD(P)-dependent oxidoreductase n=1 Tax=Actinocorallia sp. API 0066 TaxID=2896846 RepID=UPI001E639ED2|nr:NAD(P)-binding domain-containing protein [Actinocorallia sp. API 0066]MCD0449073.1 NAD(P)-binding domain-containing protein [Actinocorallia sp. API 0066]
MAEPVAVLGLGLMGSALAGAFLRRGHPTTVWNRSPERAAPLVARGALRAGTVAEAVSAGGLTVVCLSDNDAVSRTCESAGRAFDGRTLVNLTSGTSREARGLAAWAADQGAAYLDGKLLATPDTVGGPDTAVLYGGRREPFDAHHATLRAIGGGLTRLGDDPGLPALYDVALLDILWASLNGFLHASALVATEDVRAGEFAPFADLLFAALPSFVARCARQIDEGAHAAEDSTLETHLPAARNLVAECLARGVDADPPRRLRAVIEKAIAQGHGKDGYASVVEQFRKAPLEHGGG